MQETASRTKAFRGRAAVAVALATLALAGGACAASDEDGSSDENAAASGPATVRTAFYKAISNANLYKLKDFAGDQLSVEYLNFVSGVDVLRAVQTGDLDLAPIAANQFLVALDQGMDIVAVSGVNRGGIDIVLRKDLVPAGDMNAKEMAYTGDRPPYELLKGRSLGVLRGTYPDIALREYLSDNGVDPANEKFVSFPDFGSMVQAMQKKQVDAFSAQNPFPAMARLKGVGVHLAFPYPALRPAPGEVGDFDPLQMAMVVVGRRDWIDKNPEATQAYVTALTKANAHLESDRAEWIKATKTYAGLDDPLLNASIDPSKDGKDESLWQNDLLDPALYQSGLETWVPILEKLGYINDNITDKVADHITYRFLEKATGKPKEELGAS